MKRAGVLGNDIIILAAQAVRTVRRELELPATVRILSLVSQYEPVTASQLAGFDNTSQPTMSAAVADLVARGYLAKTPDPSDARAALLSLTEEGRSALAKVRARIAGHVEERLTEAGIDPQDLEATVRVLATLAEKKAL